MDPCPVTYGVAMAVLLWRVVVEAEECVTAWDCRRTVAYYEEVKLTMLAMTCLAGDGVIGVGMTASREDDCIHPESLYGASS